MLTFLRKSGKKALAMQVIVKMDMGIGSFSSAIKGDKIVENLANRLQMPNAVEQRAVGNICGVDKYDTLKANEMPNFAKRTKIAIKKPSAWKKMTRKSPPAAARMNAIINDSLTPNLFMTKPLDIWAMTSAVQDSDVFM